MDATTYDIAVGSEINTKGVSRKEISDVIKAYGIRPVAKGYRYLCDCIEIIIEHPEYLDAITKLLYPAVKNMRKTNNWGCIERAIRHEINNAEDFWVENHQHMPEEMVKIQKEVFPLGGKLHYSNKEFIALVADYFLLRR